MFIPLNLNTNINFKNVVLNDTEEFKANETLSKMKAETSEYKMNRLQNDLLEIFDKHIKKEAKNKTQKWLSFDDVLQSIYLSFFETIGKLKNGNVGLSELISSINKFKPGENELHDIYSSKYSPFLTLDKKIFEGNKEYSERFANDCSVTYKSSASPEECRLLKQELDKAIKNTPNLSEKEQRIVELRSNGILYKQIALETGFSHVLSVLNKYKIAIAKIQQANNSLPESYHIQAQKLKNLLGCKIDSGKFVNVFVELGHVPKDDNIAKIAQDIINLAKYFEVSIDEIIKAYINNPLRMDENSIHIIERSNNLMELLNLDKKIAYKIYLITSTFHTKTEIIEKDIDDITNFLEISREDYAKLRKKNIYLITKKFKPFSDKFLFISKLLKLNKEETTKVITRFPQLISLPTETIQTAIKEHPKILRIEEDKYLSMAEKVPSILAYKSETLKDNIRKSSKACKMSQKNFVQTYALNRPTILLNNPKTLGKKIEILSFYLKLKNLSKKPIIRLEADNVLYTTILLFLVTGKPARIDSSVKDKLLDFLHSNQQKSYELEVKDDKCLPEFLKFAETFSKEHFGINIFKFKIVK